jgi:hypothetical protein
VASPINTLRLAIGSLAAGVVVNAVDYVINNVVLARDWQQIARRHNIDQSAMGSTSAFATFVAIDLAIGFLLVWTYVAIRPRFGPGPGTAVKAGAAVWAVATLAMGLFGGWFVPWDLIARNAGMLLVGYVGGALAGGWLYREGV